MIATGVIVVKGWQLYGPSTEQVTALAAAALEKAQTAWSGAGEQMANAPSSTVDPRSVAPPVVAETPAAVPITNPIVSAPQLVPMKQGGSDASMTSSDAAPTTPAPSGAATGENSVAKLLAQLKELGAANAQLMPWGSSGGLYRCCCQAKCTERAAAARHFEAVAGEPTAAVEQVVAKVEAWRTEQQSLLR
jgi:hypothetical protein